MEKHKIVSDIMSMFKTHGQIEYGERCNQASHSVQAGLFAKDKGYDDELILSAFLHDIGHLVPLVEKMEFETMGEFGIQQHDKIGAHYLKNKGFSERIFKPVENHVACKKYLCFKEQEYYDLLSEASKETLKHQGGPMQADEAAQFEADPTFEESIKIRRLDDEAKIQDFEVKNEHWDYFEKLLFDYFNIN